MDIKRLIGLGAGLVISLSATAADERLSTSEYNKLVQVITTNLDNINTYENKVLRIKAFPIYSEEFAACRQVEIAKYKAYSEFTACKINDKWNIKPSKKGF